MLTDLDKYARKTKDTQIQTLAVNHHANAKEQRAWLLELETKTAISQQFQQMFHAGPRQPGELGRK